MVVIIMIFIIGIKPLVSRNPSAFRYEKVVYIEFHLFEAGYQSKQHASIRNFIKIPLRQRIQTMHSTITNAYVLIKKKLYDIFSLAYRRRHYFSSLRLKKWAMVIHIMPLNDCKYCHCCVQRPHGSQWQLFRCVDTRIHIYIDFHYKHIQICMWE